MVGKCTIINILKTRWQILFKISIMSSAWDCMSNWKVQTVYNEAVINKNIPSPQSALSLHSWVALSHLSRPVRI